MTPELKLAVVSYDSPAVCSWMRTDPIRVSLAFR
jgi:hypothetical protein